MVSVDRAAALVGGVSPAAIGKGDGGVRDSSIGVSGATPFVGLMHSILDQTQTLNKQASDAGSGLISGQGVEIHDVMIAQQNASVAFELALQVRNKAVSAYQQMMGMQF